MPLHIPMLESVVTVKGGLDTNMRSKSFPMRKLDTYVVES